VAFAAVVPTGVGLAAGGTATVGGGGVGALAGGVAGGGAAFGGSVLAISGFFAGVGAGGGVSAFDGSTIEAPVISTAMEAAAKKSFSVDFGSNAKVTVKLPLLSVPEVKPRARVSFVLGDNWIVPGLAK
jgi:hypothetical protein